MRETPSFTEFDPNHVLWQMQTIEAIENFDYSLGAHRCLFSGSVGSAKSLLLAHLILKHVVEHERARCMIGRLTLGDLESTLLQTILDHMDGVFVEGEDYEHTRSKPQMIKFYNGSEIICRSWHKKNFKQFRSLKLSMVGIEELTENGQDYWDFHDAVYQRLGRLPNVPVNLMLSATNPDAPTHPAYKDYVIASESDPLTHVFYSLTDHNPFLPKWYVQNLKDKLSPREADRMIRGQWVELAKDIIYYNYSRERNFIKQPYKYHSNYPLDLMFDFNIGKGKPMSAALGQYINGMFHVEQTFLIDGARTEDMLEEMAGHDIFERPCWFRVFGDATGSSKDTRSVANDYEIIMRFLENYKTKQGRNLRVTKHVPRSNPRIRRRHNLLNGLFYNDNGNVQLKVYEHAEPADEGFRLTELKKGAGYIEDDSMRFQHVTTAIGYWCHFVKEILEDDGDGLVIVRR
jgi:hypothetical protein